MTPNQQAQTATNNRIVMAAAARLDAAGFNGGDSYRFIEQLLAAAHADGWRPLPRPIPVRGPGGTAEARRAALKAAAEAVQRAKDSRKKPLEDPA